MYGDNTEHAENIMTRKPIQHYNKPILFSYGQEVMIIV